jgi:hypothetical protein
MKSVARIPNGQLALDDLPVLQIFGIERGTMSLESCGNDQRLIDSVAVIP